MRDINTIKHDLTNNQQNLNQINREINDCQRNIATIERDLVWAIGEVNGAELMISSYQIQASQEAKQGLAKWESKLQTFKNTVAQKQQLLNTEKAKLNNCYHKANEVVRTINKLEQELTSAQQAWEQKTKNDINKYDKGGPSGPSFKSAFGGF